MEQQFKHLPETFLYLTVNHNGRVSLWNSGAAAQLCADSTGEETVFIYVDNALRRRLIKAAAKATDTDEGFNP